MSSSYDTTSNAYAFDRVPAGSSGGTASGVAASFGVAGLGSDTGNSIRGPSSHLALVGMRSTIGLTSRDGVIPLYFDRDIAGPMARSVEDAARMFNVVAGYDPADHYTEAGRGRKEADYTAGLDANGLEGARLAVLRELVDDETADTAVIRIFEEAVADLARLGAAIVDPFDFDLQAQLDREGMFCRRFRYDMHQYLSSLGENAPIRDVLEVLETGQHADYSEQSLRRHQEIPMDVHPQDRARAEYLGDNSQLVAPATGMPAITVPMGFTYGTLPAGLQILARPYDELLLFRLAYAYEQGTHHRGPPEGFPAL